MVAEAVGFVSSVDGGGNIGLTARDGPLFGATNGRYLAGSVQADEKEGIAQTGTALFGDMTDTAEITGLFGDDIETGEGPNLLGVSEALGVTKMSQITCGQQRTDAGDAGQNSGGTAGNELVSLIDEGLQLALDGQVEVKLGLELVGQQGSQFGRRQEGLVGPIEGNLSRFGATATDMLPEEGLNAILTERQKMMGIGAMLQKCPHPLPLQRFGQNQRHRRLSNSNLKLKLVRAR